MQAVEVEFVRQIVGFHEEGKHNENAIESVVLDLLVMPSSETNPQTFDCILDSASDEQLRVSPSDEQTRDEKKKKKTRHHQISKPDTVPRRWRANRATKDQSSICSKAMDLLEGAVPPSMKFVCVR